MNVEICPVCKGRCTVSADFYDVNCIKFNSCPVTCRSCNGKGYIVIPYDISSNYMTDSCRSCATCSLNDGVVYTSNPPCYKCTIDGQFYYCDHSCDNYKI